MEASSKIDDRCFKSLLPDRYKRTATTFAFEESGAKRINIVNVVGRLESNNKEQKKNKKLCFRFLHR